MIACSRMYNVCPGARQAWDALFLALSEMSGVELEIIAHAAPLPLTDLWRREDLGAAFMCGWPFITLDAAVRPVPVAAPIADAAWAEGKALYATHLVVAADSPLASFDQTIGHRLGWTARDSQSGYHAVRHFLLGRDWQGPTVGPLLNPSGVVQALLDGRIDVGPVDSYAFSLLERHEPDSVARLRIVATTRSTPSPLLVASRQADGAMVGGLRAALLRMSRTPSVRPVLDALCLSGFDAVDERSYGSLIDMQRQTVSVRDW